MKKTLSLLLALLFVGSAFAQKAPTTKLVSNSEEQIVVNVQMNGFATNRVMTPQGEQFIVSVPGMVSALEAGAPDLPMFAIPAIIGDRAEMTVNVIDAQYTDYTDMDIAPSKGNFSRQINPDDVPYTYGPMYEENAFFPATQAYLEAPYILRDFRGQNIMVRPFAYNAQTRTLRVYDNLTIEMKKVSDNGVNQKLSRKSNTIKVDPEMKQAYSRRFINFGQGTAKYTFIEDRGSMIVICPDQYMNAMQPYVDWKNQSGRPTTMVSLSEAGGNNDTQIKAYIQNLYEQSDLEFILLVGDYNDLTPHSMNGGRSDNWFGQLEGSDYYIEAFTGRFSVQSETDVQTHVNKVIHYERDMTEEDTWLSNGIGIGANEGAGSGHMGGEADYVHVNFIRDTLLHYTYTNVSQQYSGVGSGTNANAISTDVNNGASIINYCNHGSQTSWAVANYSNSNVNALVNDNKLPFVWSVACNNGEFNGTCFGEAWLRATNNTTGEPTGAIGGMFSWISQPWTPPMTGQDEMVDILTEWINTDLFNHTFGSASLNGNMKILDAHPSDAGNTHNTWILFGDPSLMVRTAAPASMNVTLNPAVLMIGMSTLEVNAENTPFGIATLSNAEGVIASAYIVDGVANLEFNALSAVETLTLTVMGYNKVTEVMTFDVLPAEGAYVSVTGYSPNFAPVNQETNLSMTFKNVGADPTEGVTTVTLSCDNQQLEIVNATAEFEVLAADEETTLTNAFSFIVAEGVADGTKFQIDVNMVCGREEWSGKAIITAGQAILNYTNTAWPGNFVAGEELTLVANFTNTGHYMATNAVAHIECNNPYATVLNETVELGTIDPQGVGAAVFQIAIAADCPETEQIIVNFNVEADGGLSADGSITLKNSCNVVFVLNDSYGDGWNGNQLVVAFDDGTPTQQLTIETGNSATYVLEIGNGVHVTLSWIMGSWNTECSFTVSYEGGEQIYACSSPSGGTLYEFDCSCAASTDTYAPVENITFNMEDHTLTLTWDAQPDASGYFIYRNGIEIGYVQAPEYSEEIPMEMDYTYCIVAEYSEGLSIPECVILTDLLFLGEMEAEFSIYPNPVNSTLYVNSGNAEFSYVMYNGMGQMVANGTAQGSMEINVSGMVPGVYFLHLTTGTQTMVQKVVVK